MKNIKTFNQFNEAYTQEFPMGKQMGVTTDDVMQDTQYSQSENKFQQVQEYMKVLLKPMILKKNKNADDNDIEKVSDSFFNLGNNKAQEIKRMVDNCKDTKQCAQDIINQYFKYVKINFGLKDTNTDVEPTL